MKGSPFGWAVDFNGSARIPAASNDLYSLKVSAGRIAADGLGDFNEKLLLGHSAIAMMSTDFELITHMAKQCPGANFFKRNIDSVNMPWRASGAEAPKGRRPTFAVLRCDGSVQTHPPVQRALRIITTHLLEAGHGVLEWEPPDHATAVRTYLDICEAAG